MRPATQREIKAEHSQNGRRNIDLPYDLVHLDPIRNHPRVDEQQWNVDIFVVDCGGMKIAAVTPESLAVIATDYDYSVIGKVHVCESSRNPADQLIRSLNGV